MASKRVQAYLGLPTAEDITTTQTNVIWRDKLAREDRCARALSRHTAPRPPAHARRAACDPPLPSLPPATPAPRARDEWHKRWGEHFGVTRSPSEAGLTRPHPRRPIRTPPSLPPSAAGERRLAAEVPRHLEPTATSKAYEEALVRASVLQAKGPTARWPANGGGTGTGTAGRSEVGGRAASEVSG